MRIIRILNICRTRGTYLKTFLQPGLQIQSATNSCRHFILTQPKQISTCIHNKIRIYNEDDSDSELESDFINKINLEIEDTSARDLLYTDSDDPLLSRIYNCVSVEELLNVFDSNSDSYTCDHILQTVLVLWDLKKIMQDVNSMNGINVNKSSKLFVNSLHQNDSFMNLLRLIEAKHHVFDVNKGTYLLQYLVKIGMEVETELLQKIVRNLEAKLCNDFSLSAAHRFLDAVFSENSLRPYLISQSLVPQVFQHIDVCDSPSPLLGDLTQSLNKLHHLVTDEVLNRFKFKVAQFLDDGKLTAVDYKVILKVVLLLNYPKWRNKNVPLLSRCMSLIKDKVSTLNINELIILYDTFSRIQEPGPVLNELQRCCSKYLQQLEDTVSPLRLNMFSSLIYFSPPHHRTNLQQMLAKFIKEHNDPEELLFVCKLMTYAKVTDEKLCDRFWNKMLKLLRNDRDCFDVVTLGQYYMNFNSSIDGYRHPKFEHAFLKELQNLIRNDICLFYPPVLCKIVGFLLIYSTDLKLIHHVIQKLELDWGQLSYFECIRLSSTLRLFSNLDDRYLKNSLASRLRKVIDNVIIKETNNNLCYMYKNNCLLKSCIFKGDVDITITNKLLSNYKNLDGISSKSIEDITYCLLHNNTLSPEIIDKMTDYVVKTKDSMLAFNIEKLLHLCYWLGYRPKNSDEFFNSAVDIIIRDQERMGGLALLHCGLSLCFFNKLPNFLVKYIFNVEFLDRLDAELANCYSKDKYPQRVRNNMMQLNRAVCLDYPENNVPWFHQKYVEEVNEKPTKASVMFAQRIKRQLVSIIAPNTALEEDVITPYGYHIDFVINLNAKNEIARNPKESTTRLALLLIPQYAFTRMNVQLRGHFQMKKRHLEILGYRVLMINYRDWIELFYTNEPAELLTNLISPNR